MSRSGLCLDVAGVVIAVDLPSPVWLPPMLNRYELFLSDDEPLWRIALTVADPPADPRGSWVEHDGHVSRFQVGPYAGWIDLTSRRAEVRTPSAERAFSALERVAVFILMQALPRDHRALLLHGTGIDFSGTGLVFTGPSGSGKTTIAQLAGGRYAVLGDENVIVRDRFSGPELLSTPFWGQSTPPELVARKNVCLPLRAIITMAHEPDFSLTRLSPIDAVAALLATEKVATERVESAEAWLRVVGALVSSVPILRLGFAPTPDLWGFLPDALARVSKERWRPQGSPLRDGSGCARARV